MKETNVGTENQSTDETVENEAQAETEAQEEEEVLTPEEKVRKRVRRGEG